MPGVTRGQLVEKLARLGALAGVLGEAVGAGELPAVDLDDARDEVEEVAGRLDLLTDGLAAAVGPAGVV